MSKLLAVDLKRALKAYKAVKTVCKTNLTNLIIRDGFCVIQDKDVDVIIDTDTWEHGEDIALTDDTITLLEKCIGEENVHITKDIISIGELKIQHTSLNTDNLTYKNADTYIYAGTVLAEDILSTIKTVKYAVSKDTTRPLFTNILWKNNDLVALDGYRIVVRDISNSNSVNSELLIPQTAYELLEKLLPKNELLTLFLDIEKNEVCFDFGDYQVISRLADGTYFKYEDVIKQETTINFNVNRKALIKAAEMMILDKNPMILNISPGELKLSTKTATHTLENSLPIVCKADLKIAFNPKYLVEALKNITDDEVNFNLNQQNTPLIITHSKGLDLILPVRLGD